MNYAFICKRTTKEHGQNTERLQQKNHNNDSIQTNIKHGSITKNSKILLITTYQHKFTKHVQENYTQPAYKEKREQQHQMKFKSNTTCSAL